jgi:hypothetical protein
MTMGHAWQFECVLESGCKLKSWFYSDTEQDATRRIKEYFGAKLISLKEIQDPLEINKKQAERDKIKEAMDKKKQEEFVQKYYD